MKREDARELLEKFYRHVNDKNGKLTVTWDDVETFLSTLPEEKEEDGWISVEDELPELEVSVLVRYETDGMSRNVHYSVGRIYGKTKRFSGEFDWTKATHWMPLPEFNPSK